MYRILRVNSDDGQIRVIKNSSIGSFKWHSSSSDIAWPDSSLYKSLNSSSFLTNTTYIPIGRENKISSIDWKYGEIDIGQTEIWESLFDSENDFANSINAKIGLLYPSDIVMSSLGGVMTSLDDSEWLLYIDNTWLITRPRVTGSSKYETAHYIWNRAQYESMIYYLTMNNAKSIYPVFHISNGVRIIGGDGTESNPYLIN